MGWWDESIMGGDAPLDVEGDFEHKFGMWKPEDKDHDEPPTMTYPGEQSIVKFINQMQSKGYENYEVSGPVGFMMMELGWLISNELKQRIIEDVDSEDISRWRDPTERKRNLDEFKELLLAYDGTAKEMPHQPGLFEKFAEKIGTQMTKKIGTVHKQQPFAWHSNIGDATADDGHSLKLLVTEPLRTPMIVHSDGRTWCISWQELCALAGEQFELDAGAANAEEPTAS